MALFAAIVGGGIKYKDIEVGHLPSLWRQGLLGVFGLVAGLIGLGLVLDEHAARLEPEPAFNSSEMNLVDSDGNPVEANSLDSDNSDGNVTDGNMEIAADDAAEQDNVPREQVRDVYLLNSCREPVEFWLAFNKDGHWVSDGSWKFASSHGNRVASDDGSTIATGTDEIYIYAKAPGVEWSGNTKIGDFDRWQKAGVSIDQDGRFKIELVCNS